MPFSDFYLIFKLIFLMNFLKSRKRGVILVHRPPYADVACVPDVATSWRGELTGRRADVARGTTGGCDVAMRPRGRAADGPRETRG